MILRTQALFYDVERASLVIRDHNRCLLHASEFMWLLSSICVGFGIIIPDPLDPRASSFLNLPEILSSTISFDNNLLVKASYTRAMYSLTPSTV